MKIKLVQTKYKTANFEFNYESIIKNIDTDSDLIIFPDVRLEQTGGRSMVFDSDCKNAESEMFSKLAEEFKSQMLLIGTILLYDGQCVDINDKSFKLGEKTIYISDRYNENAECDCYILAKNSYYVMSEEESLIGNINPRFDVIYVNAVCMCDENIYAGRSFAKNKHGETVLMMPLCEEYSKTVNFERAENFKQPQREEELFKVLTFGLKEYCENTGFKKVILGLSGGIDSALTAVLAKEALGGENVLGIMLPAMFSSEGSVTDSEELAENLGIKIDKISITNLFDNFIQTAGKNDRRYDLAEENLQARLRGLVLMFYSNRNGYLLLSTGNKSEAAMGYGTLYGDMAGGLNLLCDLTKTKVYKLSNWLNRNGEVIPQAIIDKAPSAELRPNQKDQDSLPEYDVLDSIIEMFVEKQLSREEIYEHFDKDLVDTTIKRIYRAQFKRNQACMGIRVTENAFCSNFKLPAAQGMF